MLNRAHERIFFVAVCFIAVFARKVLNTALNSKQYLVQFQIHDRCVVFFWEEDLSNSNLVTYCVGSFAKPLITYIRSVQRNSSYDFSTTLANSIQK